MLDAVGEAPVTQAKRVAELVRRPRVKFQEVAVAADPHVLPSGEEWTSVEIELKYVGYLEREREAAKKLEEMASFRLPADLPYPEFKSLSTEARDKLVNVRPESLAQAGRIPGVSPSDLQNLVLEVIKLRRSVA